MTRKLQNPTLTSMDILSIIVTDENNRKLNPSGVDPSRIKVSDKFWLTIDSECIYNTALQSKNVGHIQVIFSLEPIYKTIANLRNNLIIIFALILIAIFVIVTFSSFVFVIKPIKKIARWVDELASGNFNQKFEMKRKDEIGYLTVHLRKMATDLKSSFEKIEVQNKEILNYNNSLEDLVNQRSNQLVKAEKMASLGGMVAGIAHEINTPVGISVTAATHLKHDYKIISDNFSQNNMKKSDLEKFFKTVKESTDLIFFNLNRASDLVQSFKKIAVDQSSEAKRRFNFYKYLQDVILSLKPALKKTKHEIVFNCPEDLYITSYPGPFSQIFTNLIMNSIIHGFENIESGLINIDISLNDDYFVIMFSNNGEPIPSEMINKIFEPFYTTKRNTGGSGLGLNLVHNLVFKKLNGTIKCSSDNEKTTFLIEIPASEVTVSN